MYKIDSFDIGIKGKSVCFKKIRVFHLLIYIPAIFEFIGICIGC